MVPCGAIRFSPPSRFQPGRSMRALVNSVLGGLDRHADRVVRGVAAAILILGIAYSFLLGSELRYWDEREYVTLATNLVERGEYVFEAQRAFRPPLYPMLLAGLLALGTPIEGLRIANFVLLAASAVLLHRIAKRIAGRRAAGALAALWLLGYPVLLYAAGTLYPQTLAGFLLLAALDLLLRDGRARPARVAAGGLVFGLLVLAVPTFLPMVAVLGAWLWWRGRALLPAVVLVLATAAPLVPWTARNHAVFGRFVFIASNSGLNLLYGNCENARPGLGTNMDKSRWEAQAEPLDELGRDRFYRDAALAWIRDNPGAAVRLYFGKLLHHFAWSEQLATAGEGGRARTLVLAATWLPLLGVVLVRLLLLRRRPLHPIEVALFALYLLHALASAVFFTRIRFRLPADLMLLVLAANTVAGPPVRSAPAVPPGTPRPRDVPAAV